MSPSDALVAALLEIERHVGGIGWDQPARLFALVPTAELIAAEPQLAEHLSGASEPQPEQLSAIEQEGFNGGSKPASDGNGHSRPHHKVTVSRATAALVERRLVERSPSRHDGRSHHLALTQEGVGLYEMIAPAALAMEQQILAGLNEQERGQLTSILAKLRDAVSALK